MEAKRLKAANKRAAKLARRNAAQKQLQPKGKKCSAKLAKWNESKNSTKTASLKEKAELAKKSQEEKHSQVLLQKIIKRQKIKSSGRGRGRKC